MAANPEAVAAALAGLLQPNARARLLARGLARGMVWRDGVVPPGGPTFVPELTPDLLDFGYSVLALALELRDANLSRAALAQFSTDDAFRVAAEAIESASRRGEIADPDRGRHLVVAASAFHIGGFAARSFSLLEASVLSANLSSAERALALLLRRDVGALRLHIHRWLGAPELGDDALAESLKAEEGVEPEDAALLVLNAMYHRAVGRADSALLFGDRTTWERAIAALGEVIAGTATIGNIPLWWVATLTLHLLRDLWSRSLHSQLPQSPAPGLTSTSWSELRGQFIDLLALRAPPQLDLWPSQLDAASRCTDESDHLVVALPTSAGKTRIAELCILRTLAGGRRVIYVTPLRALSAQVERVLAQTFCPLGATVTSLYGAAGETSLDEESLASASIVVATPEKVDFALRQDPAVLEDVGLIVFDEGHMIGLGSREVRYEVLIQRLLRRVDAPGRRIVCLSAMFNPDDEFFGDFGNWLRKDDPRPTIHVKWRPTRQLFATLDWSVPSGVARLSFVEGEKPFVPRFLERQQSARKPKPGKAAKTFPADDKELCIAASAAFAKDGHSVLVYSPERRLVEPFVRAFAKAVRDGYVKDLKAPAPADIAVALAIGREWLGAQHDAVIGLPLGVGAHHGTLPRPFQSAVEDLLHRRKLSVVVASPTLAQGVDLSCSVLIFRSMYRYSASARNNRSVLDAAQFANVVGRAGRAYVDLDGITVCPIFKPNRATTSAFLKLIEESRGGHLASGLAHLIFVLGQTLSEKLAVPRDQLLEYVLNQQNLWSDGRLGAAPENAEVDEVEQADVPLATLIADLDVAILSLVDPLEAPVESLASALDEVLKGSLWERTTARLDAEGQRLERGLLLSRAEWLWRSTSVEQRRACFKAGLGKVAGTFLYDHIEDMVGPLADLEAAVRAGDAAGAATSAIAFARIVMKEPFFAMRKLPETWEAALTAWIGGVAFSAIVTSPGIAAFVNDHVAFKVVWAAEAVRAQAVEREHERAAELGDGPALALTYGVPSRQAAILCQSGFASRTGALWVSRTLADPFEDMPGMRRWETKHAKSLSEPEFWETSDQHLLWSRRSTNQLSVSRAAWSRWTIRLRPTWAGEPPKPASTIRFVESSGSITVCDGDLSPLGTIAAKPPGSYHLVRGVVETDGSVAAQCFGTRPRAARAR